VVISHHASHIWEIKLPQPPVKTPPAQIIPTKNKGGDNKKKFYFSLAHGRYKTRQKKKRREGSNIEIGRKGAQITIFVFVGGARTVFGYWGRKGLIEIGLVPLLWGVEGMGHGGLCWGW